MRTLSRVRGAMRFIIDEFIRIFENGPIAKALCFINNEIGLNALA